MAEPRFVAKDGQVDYTNIRYCPVINAIVDYKGEVLLVKRHKSMRLYPGAWHCIGGFLDDTSSIEEKVREELAEEVGIEATDIVSMKRGQVVLSEASDYRKTWLVVPVLVKVKTKKFSLNWEADEAAWFKPAEINKLKVVPSFIEVLKQFY